MSSLWAEHKKSLYAKKEPFGSFFLAEYLFLAVVTTAALLMMAAVMMLPFMVMVTSGLGILLQLSFGKSLGCLICIPLNTGIDLDACLGQGYLSSAANAAADQSLHLMLFEKNRQSAVTGAAGIHHSALISLAAFHLIHLELLGFAKVLEHLAVFIGYCDFHGESSPPFCNGPGGRNGRSRPREGTPPPDLPQ